MSVIPSIPSRQIEGNDEDVQHLINELQACLKEGVYPKLNDIQKNLIRGFAEKDPTQILTIEALDTAVIQESIALCVALGISASVAPKTVMSFSKSGAMPFEVAASEKSRSFVGKLFGSQADIEKSVMLVSSLREQGIPVSLPEADMQPLRSKASSRFKGGASQDLIEKYEAALEKGKHRATSLLNEEQHATAKRVTQEMTEPALKAPEKPITKSDISTTPTPDRPIERMVSAAPSITPAKEISQPAKPVLSAKELLAQESTIKAPFKKIVSNNRIQLIRQWQIETDTFSKQNPDPNETRLEPVEVWLSFSEKSERSSLRQALKELEIKSTFAEKEKSVGKRNAIKGTEGEEDKIVLIVKVEMYEDIENFETRLVEAYQDFVPPPVVEKAPQKQTKESQLQQLQDQFIYRPPVQVKFKANATKSEKTRKVE